jgi:uncharacterized membrane protein
MRRITRYFFQGLLFLVPVVASIYVVYEVFTRVDSLFSFPVPGLGVVVTLAAITLIGFLGSNFVSKKLIGLVDGMFRRLPLVKLFYTSVKDLLEAFVGDRKAFNRPVLVTLFPGSSVRAVGFVTRESLDALGVADSVAVYLPESYNFAGNLIVVGNEQVTPISADRGDVMKFIVSGGVAAGGA